MVQEEQELHGGGVDLAIVLLLFPYGFVWLLSSGLFPHSTNGEEQWSKARRGGLGILPAIFLEKQRQLFQKPLMDFVS